MGSRTQGFLPCMLREFTQDKMFTIMTYYYNRCSEICNDRRLILFLLKPFSTHFLAHKPFTKNHPSFKTISAWFFTVDSVKEVFHWIMKLVNCWSELTETEVLAGSSPLVGGEAGKTRDALLLPLVRLVLAEGTRRAAARADTTGVRPGFASPWNAVDSNDKC